MRYAAVARGAARDHVQVRFLSGFPGALPERHGMRSGSIEALVRGGDPCGDQFDLWAGKSEPCLGSHVVGSAESAEKQVESARHQGERAKNVGAALPGDGHPCTRIDDFRRTLGSGRTRPRFGQVRQVEAHALRVGVDDDRTRDDGST